MLLGLILYNLIGGLLFSLGFPILILYNLAQGKYSSRLVERLGRYPLYLRTPKDAPQKRPIWIHAVSVGEVKAAVALTRKIQAQLPEVPILFSTTTPAGRDTAEFLLGKEIPVVYFPLDFWPAVKRALRHIRPKAFVVLETELWPNFLFWAHRWGTRLVLVNGRISKGSFSRYRKIRFFLRPLLRRFRILLVREAEDGERFKALGADPAKVTILGNIKYDGLADQAQEVLERSWRKLLDIEEGTPVWVAGSTRNGEEAILVDVYREIKKTLSRSPPDLGPQASGPCCRSRRSIKATGVGLSIAGRYPLRGKAEEGNHYPRRSNRGSVRTLQPGRCGFLRRQSSAQGGAKHSGGRCLGKSGLLRSLHGGFSGRPKGFGKGRGWIYCTNPGRIKRADSLLVGASRRKGRAGSVRTGGLAGLPGIDSKGS